MKDNNIIERIWVEVKSRVNYPIKNALGQFAVDGLIDMTQDHVKFAVLWVFCRVAKVGLQVFAEARNHDISTMDHAFVNFLQVVLCLELNS